MGETTIRLRRVTPRIVKGERSMFFEDKGNRVIGVRLKISGPFALTRENSVWIAFPEDLLEGF
jgi:hypothetical protein